jgi:two-component system sensor histidine kinase KdpD
MADAPSIATSSSVGRAAGGYLLAVVATIAAVLVASIAQRWLGLVDLSSVFMLAVLVVAARTRTGPAVLAAVLCFLAFNFFFIEPRYTFYISARHGVATVVLFLAAALLAGRLAAKLAMQVQALREANLHASARQELAQRLTVAGDEEAVVLAARDVFRHSLGAESWVRASAERATESVEQHGWWTLPLHSPDGALGVVALKLPANVGPLDEGERRLARAMADDVAQALVRVRLGAALESQRLAHETERLRSALLSSVSHDLRTPLAAILGAAESLEHYGGAMDEADRRALLESIRVESERLDGYIQNLLDMTRLGQGNIVLRCDWIGVDELIGAAIARLQRSRPDAVFEVSVQGGMEPMWVQPALVEQAMFNVLDNAVKFSPPGAVVRVDARMVGDDRVRIDVIDDGPGVPESERGRIFDLFHSVERGDRGSNGTGLGLAIAQGVVRAHGGEIEALAGAQGRGTAIRVVLPRVAPTEQRAP